MVHKICYPQHLNGRIYTAVKKKRAYDRYAMITTRNGQWGVPIMVLSVRVNVISLQ
jgi:hypothetical protein